MSIPISDRPWLERPLMDRKSQRPFATFCRVYHGSCHILNPISDGAEALGRDGSRCCGPGTPASGRGLAHYGLEPGRSRPALSLTGDRLR
jgi:hypothetical protein